MQDKEFRALKNCPLSRRRPLHYSGAACGAALWVRQLSSVPCPQPQIAGRAVLIVPVLPWRARTLWSHPVVTLYLASAVSATTFLRLYAISAGRTASHTVAASCSSLRYRTRWKPYPLCCVLLSPAPCVWQPKRGVLDAVSLHQQSPLLLGRPLPKQPLASLCPNDSGSKDPASDGRRNSRCIAPSPRLGVELPYFRPYTGTYAKNSLTSGDFLTLARSR